jgi:hypothetical protein
MEVPQTFSEFSVHPRARAPSACVFHAAATNKRVYVREARIASREEHRQSASIVLGKAKNQAARQGAQRRSHPLFARNAHFGADSTIMWFVAVDSAAVACEWGSISKMIPAGHPQYCMQVCWEGPVGAPQQGFPHLLLDLCHHLLACKRRLALAASAKRKYLPKAGR